MKTGFPPIASGRPRVLILGSMPGEESLRRRQYYAHPRNAFWPVMGTLFKFSPDESYAARTRHLVRNHVALWDVLKECKRRGSLDSSIDGETISVNNFTAFFRKYPDIRTVFFNGTRAEQEFNRRVKPKLPAAFHHLEYVRLPSTSPAMASLTLEQKTSRWAVIRKDCC